MGLKEQLREKKREQSIKKNLYNQLMEEEIPTGFINKMTLHRKVFALYKNLNS
ncbi:MAG: hypothetical protein ACRCWI_06420 [Brevinema sp.]